MKLVRMLTIFDCDGVLVDSEVVALETLSEMMGAWGQPMSVAACRDAFMGLHNDDILRGIEARTGRTVPGGGPGLRARILENVLRDLKPVAGAAVALERLDGPRCVASSSDQARIRQLLAVAGLDRFFDDAIFSGTEVPRGKPAPDLFLHAAETMGFPPAHCVVVEDSTQGVTAGVAAGMRVIGFTGGAHTDPEHAARLLAAGAATIVASMADMPAALGIEKLGRGPARNRAAI